MFSSFGCSNLMSRRKPRANLIHCDGSGRISFFLSVKIQASKKNFVFIFLLLTEVAGVLKYLMAGKH
jgi:hypothetical protein